MYNWRKRRALCDSHTGICSHFFPRPPCRQFVWKNNFSRALFLRQEVTWQREQEAALLHIQIEKKITEKGERTKKISASRNGNCSSCVIALLPKRVLESSKTEQEWQAYVDIQASPSSTVRVSCRVVKLHALRALMYALYVHGPFLFRLFMLILWPRSVLVEVAIVWWFYLSNVRRCTLAKGLIMFKLFTFVSIRLFDFFLHVFWLFASFILIRWPALSNSGS